MPPPLNHGGPVGFWLTPLTDMDIFYAFLIIVTVSMCIEVEKTFQWISIINGITMVICISPRDPQALLLNTTNPT
jgi:hypothetical protein